MNPRPIMSIITAAIILKLHNGYILLLIIETHTNKCLSKSRYNDSQNIKNLILSKGHSIPYFNLKIIFSVSRNLNLLGFGPFFP